MTVRSNDPFPSKLPTPRLVLRRQHPDDAALVKEAVDASLDHLQASVAWARFAPIPLPAQRELLAASVAAFDAGISWAYSIFDANETRVLGAVALHRPDAALAALVSPSGATVIETGYWLRADSTGNGYATEATACLTELAFTHLGARHVAICHDPANLASAGVPRRLGFRCLGNVPDAQLPGREAADGSVRPSSIVWVLDAPLANRNHPGRDRVL